jgi:hypothetical protein
MQCYGYECVSISANPWNQINADSRGSGFEVKFKLFIIFQGWGSNINVCSDPDPGSEFGF